MTSSTKVKQIFQNYDRNKTNTISKLKCRSILTRLDPSWTNVELECLFELFDKSKDAPIQYEAFIDFIYDPCVCYKDYIDSKFENVIPASDFAVFTVGAPGAGKTCTVHKFLSERGWTNYVPLNKDEVLEDLFNNDMQHFKVSSQIYKTIQTQAISGGYNLTVDGTGRYIPKWVEIATLIRKESEKACHKRPIILLVVLCSQTRGMARCRSRYISTGRIVDESFAVDVYDKMDHVLASYLCTESSHFDEIFIYDNDADGSEAKLVYKKNVDGRIDIMSDGEPWWHSSLPHATIAMKQSWSVEMYRTLKFERESICAGSAPSSDFSNAVFVVGPLCPAKSKILDLVLQGLLGSDSYLYLNTEFVDNDEIRCEQHTCHRHIYEDMREDAITNGYNIVVEGNDFDTTTCVAIADHVREATSTTGLTRRVVLLVIISPSLMSQREPKATESLDYLISSYIGEKSSHFDELHIYDSYADTAQLIPLYSKIGSQETCGLRPDKTRTCVF